MTGAEKAAEQIQEELEAFFFKVDMEGFDYALLNYFPKHLGKFTDLAIMNFMDTLGAARSTLWEARDIAERIRERYNIQES